MDKKLIDGILDYTDTRSEQASKAEERKKRRSDSVMSEEGGFVPATTAQLTGKPNLLYNGAFELSQSLEVDPLGWVFEECIGVVVNTWYQENLPESFYISSGDALNSPSSEVDNNQDPLCGISIKDLPYIVNPSTQEHKFPKLVYADWSARYSDSSAAYAPFMDYLEKVDELGNTFVQADGSPVLELQIASFTGDSIELIPGSSKALLVQDSQFTDISSKTVEFPADTSFVNETFSPTQSTTRISEFSFRQHIPKGVLQPGEKYYISFSALPWDGFAEEMSVISNKVQVLQENRVPFTSLRWSHQAFPYIGKPTDAEGVPFYTFLSNQGENSSCASITPFVEFLDQSFGTMLSIEATPVNMTSGAGWYSQVYSFFVPNEGVEAANLGFRIDTDSENYKGVDYSYPRLSGVEGSSVIFDNIGLYPDKPISKAGSFVTISQSYKTKVFSDNWDNCVTSQFIAESDMYLRGVRVSSKIKDITSVIVADFSVKINGEYVYYPIWYQGEQSFDAGVRTGHSSYQTSRGIRYSYVNDYPNGSFEVYTASPLQVFGLQGQVLGELYVNSGDRVELECITSKSLELKVMFDFTKC